MNRSFALLAATFFPSAVALFYWLTRLDTDVVFTQGDVLGILAFAFIAILSEVMAVDFRFGGATQQLRSSLAYLPFLAGIVLFPPHVAVGMVAFIVAISQAIIRRHVLFRVLYNVSQAAIAASTAAVAFRVLSAGSESSFGPLMAFLAAAGLFFFTNIIFTAVAIAYIRDMSFLGILFHISGPRLSNLYYDFMATPIVALLVVAYRTDPTYNWLYLIGVSSPILLVHFLLQNREKLLAAENDLLRVLVKAIETRDPYTSGHSVRVANMAKQIAVQLGLTPSRARNIERAALLHDIGKIDPEYSSFLRKPSELTPEERAIIQTHSIRGAAILRDLNSVPAEIVSAVLYHHEWYNGNGYPEGLFGEQIPLAARIIMLCDSVDAMLSDRPYRRALTAEIVRAELLRCSGTQFDPALVDAVLASDILELTQHRMKSEVERGVLQRVG
jgi:putative nucleotidyltransferase with HDIG domain